MPSVAGMRGKIALWSQETIVPWLHSKKSKGMKNCIACFSHLDRLSVVKIHFYKLFKSVNISLVFFQLYAVAA